MNKLIVILIALIAMGIGSYGNSAIALSNLDFSKKIGSNFTPGDPTWTQTTRQTLELVLAIM